MTPMGIFQIPFILNFVQFLSSHSLSISWRYSQCIQLYFECKKNMLVLHSFIETIKMCEHIMKKNGNGMESGSDGGDGLTVKK